MHRTGPPEDTGNIFDTNGTAASKSEGRKGVTTVMEPRFLRTQLRRNTLGILSLILCLATASPVLAGDFKEDLGKLIDSELTDKIAALFEKHLKSRDDRIAELEAKVARLLGEAPAAGPKVLLGVGHSPLSDEQRKKLGADGVVVTQVLAGSPAEKAGLKSGDVILSVNGSAVNSASFKKTVNWLKPGATADLVVVRGDDKSNKKVTVVDRDAFLAGKPAAAEPAAEAKPVVLGIVLNEKLIIEEVDAGFTAAVAGLKAGDRITGLNGQSVTELDALADAVGKLKAGDKLAIKFVRGGEDQETAVVGGSAEGEARLVADAPRRREGRAGREVGRQNGGLPRRRCDRRLGRADRRGSRQDRRTGVRPAGRRRRDQGERQGSRQGCRTPGAPRRAGCGRRARPRGATQGRGGRRRRSRSREGRRRSPPSACGRSAPASWG